MQTGWENNVTLRCQLRIHENEELHCLQPLESQYDESQEMVCTMIQGEVKEWNMWRNITIESVGRSITPVLMQQPEENFVNDNRVDDGGEDEQQCENVNGKNGPKLSFTSIAPSRPASRIRVTSRLRRPYSRPRTDTSVPRPYSGSLAQSNLPNPLNIGPHKKTFQLRQQSPHPRLDASVKAIKSMRSSPSRDPSYLASGCFAWYPDDREQVEFEPFDISLSDILFVEKDYSCNAGIGVVYIMPCMARKGGVVEIIPRSLHARDLLIAFLQAGLPDGYVRNKNTELKRQPFVTITKSDDTPFDMQNFEAHAVKKRFANESSWDKMMRKTANFTRRIQETCICCEHISEENDFVSISSSKSDTDLDSSSTVGSEMEFDP